MAAQTATTPRRKAATRRQAVELIATLWEHREQLPGRSYPLAPLRQILDAISLFTEDEGRAWWGYRRRDPTEARVFRAFTRLMPCLLLLHAHDLGESPGPGDAAYEHLEQEEKEILDAVSEWLPRRTPRPTESAPVRVVFVEADEAPETTEASQGGTQGGPPEDDFEAELRSAALDALTELEHGLAQIRARLEGPVDALEQDEEPAESEDS
ncbi:MAG TPA: hypothetical protein VEA99_05780 [Gemmatimonadaceae bacterium]|nr:hypothetical protein [Gemmatimonadaceae bacterium]